MNAIVPQQFGKLKNNSLFRVTKANDPYNKNQDKLPYATYLKIEPFEYNGKIVNARYQESCFDPFIYVYIPDTFIGSVR